MNKKAIKNTIIKLAKTELKRQVMKNLLSQDNKDKLLNIVTSKFTSDIIISTNENSKNNTYYIMTDWLASVNEYMKSIMIDASVTSVSEKFLNEDEKKIIQNNPKYYNLKYGNFKFIYNKCMITVKSFQPMKNFINLNITIYGKEVYRNGIINEIKLFREKLRKKTTNNNGIFYISYKKYSIDRGWSSIRGRELNTIYSDQINNIINIIYDWKHTEKMYSKHCLSFKTGLLLYGNPGTGKTSIAKAIATHFNMRLLSINLSTCPAKNIAKLVDEIRDGMYDPNVKTLVLLEEIDLNSSNQKQEKMQELLTVLDGVESPSGTVFIATTNLIDKVDERIKREGRFDNIIEITDICKSTAIRMCEGFEVDSEKVLKRYEKEYRKDDSLLYNPAKLQKMILLEYNSMVINSDDKQLSFNDQKSNSSISSDLLKGTQYSDYAIPNNIDFNKGPYNHGNMNFAEGESSREF